MTVHLLQTSETSVH